MKTFQFCWWNRWNAWCAQSFSWRLAQDAKSSMSEVMKNPLYGMSFIADPNTVSAASLTQVGRSDPVKERWFCRIGATSAGLVVKGYPSCW